VNRALHEPGRTRGPIGIAPASAGTERSLAVKRILDYVLAGLFMIATAPLFAVIALAIKATSRGPVFFVQHRIGQDGRLFPFYKFRTMKHNSDDRVHREFSRDFITGGNGNGAKVYKLTRDPRVTSIGQFLRRTSLDELPQLFNVVRGEMSLVGPRPPLPYELEHYQDWHKRRLSIRPGITGLWQVSGRSSVPFDEMVLLDVYYIEHRSTLMDLRIMAKTLPVMVNGSGAY
jgi:lipopolysaccharide/colanic/teichoic acid biosynthesis glycosyltransferase